MNTEDLIKALEADTHSKAMPVGPAWWMAVAIAAVVAAVVFFMTLGPRPDFMQVAHTMRFQLKFVFTLVLALSAFGLVVAVSRPGSAGSGRAWWLIAAPLIMAVAVIVEMIVMPPDTWGARLIGQNMVACVACIPMIGIGPLAVFLAALRHGAPTRPVLAGAVAGLLAGGLAATFYAAHCTDDSPLFVATWYTLAIALLTGLGALGGRLFVRW